MSRDDVATFSEAYPCPTCGNQAPKSVSSFSFGFKGEVKGLSGVHGNSGVHDLDYPTLDKAVARSSEKRWEYNRERQEKINKVRREVGSHAVTSDADGNAKPTDSKTLDLRGKAINTMKKAMDNAK